MYHQIQCYVGHDDVKIHGLAKVTPACPAYSREALLGGMCSKSPKVFERCVLVTHASLSALVVHYRSLTQTALDAVLPHALVRSYRPGQQLRWSRPRPPVDLRVQTWHQDRCIHTLTLRMPDLAAFHSHGLETEDITMANVVCQIRVQMWPYTTAHGRQLWGNPSHATRTYSTPANTTSSTFSSEG